MANDSYPEPLIATPCIDAVVVCCARNAFAVALTPRAARETAQLLLRAADAAEAGPPAPDHAFAT